VELGTIGLLPKLTYLVWVTYIGMVQLT